MSHDKWGNRPLTLEADYAAPAAWYRKPIVILAFAGVVVAAAAAMVIGGGSDAGLDMTTTGTVDTGLAQFEDI